MDQYDDAQGRRAGESQRFQFNSQREQLQKNMGLFYANHAKFVELENEIRRVFETCVEAEQASQRLRDDFQKFLKDMDNALRR